jgi:zinc protease
MRYTGRMIHLAVAAALLAPAAPLAAQKTALDRSVQPKASASPEIRVPKWNKTKLSNGATLIVSPKQDLPLVAVTINFVGGRLAYEPADKLGTASFAAQMLSEGTSTRTGEQIADEQQLLGTSISGFIGDESGSIGFTALKDRLEPALALLADMLVNPTFPEAALERIRGRTLVSLAQAKEQPNTIAANVFSKVLYGDEHPYGRVTTEKTVKAVTRDDVVAFHRAYYKPGRAIITVTGDVEAGPVRVAMEKALARWAPGGERPSFAYPPLPAPKSTTIWLVDKP